VTGMLAPLRLEGASGVLCTPVISGNGTLYAPREGCPDVVVFSADGTPLSPLPVASLELSELTSDAAFDEATSTLLLADSNKEVSKLVAFDIVSRAVRWSTGLGGNCFGIAVLPAQGLVVASVYSVNELRVHHLSDGALVCTAPADRPSFIAADATTVALYVSSAYKVFSFRWNGGTLVSKGVVEAAGDTGNWRLLAVMPSAPGQHTSYLVVGTCYSPTLLVLSLPDRRLVHTHTLEGMKVAGLAADPSGTALAVCDYTSKAIHVLPWPLPGMPPLQ
jgi:hypothetical protein